MADNIRSFTAKDATLDGFGSGSGPKTLVFGGGYMPPMYFNYMKGSPRGDQVYQLVEKANVNILTVCAGTMIAGDAFYSINSMGPARDIAGEVYPVVSEYEMLSLGHFSSAGPLKPSGVRPIPGTNIPEVVQTSGSPLEPVYSLFVEGPGIIPGADPGKVFSLDAQVLGSLNTDVSFLHRSGAVTFNDPASCLYEPASGTKGAGVFFAHHPEADVPDSEFFAACCEKEEAVDEDASASGAGRGSGDAGAEGKEEEDASDKQPLLSKADVIRHAMGREARLKETTDHLKEAFLGRFKPVA